MTEVKKYPWFSDTFKLNLPHQGWLDYFWARAKVFDDLHGEDLQPEDTLEELSVFWDFDLDKLGFKLSWEGEKHHIWGDFIMTYQTLCTKCGRDLEISSDRRGVPVFMTEALAQGQEKEDLKRIVWEKKPCLCKRCETD